MTLAAGSAWRIEQASAIEVMQPNHWASSGMSAKSAATSRSSNPLASMVRPAPASSFVIHGQAAGNLAGRNSRSQRIRASSVCPASSSMHSRWDWTSIAALSLLAFLPMACTSSFSRRPASSRPSMSARVPRQSGTHHRYRGRRNSCAISANASTSASAP